MGHNEKINLGDLAKQVRKETFELCYKSKHGHLGSAFSIVDIITALYFNFLNIDSKKPKMPTRDRFILSKGHACASLYVILQKRGFFSKKSLSTFLQDNSIFAGHTNHAVPGVEISTGSLGHGLSVGIGMAYAAKKNQVKNKTVVLMSDGECNEGSVWEGALSAGHLKLNNLIAIVDYNKLQAFGQTKDVLDLEPFDSKWQSFGWDVYQIDGHNIDEITKTLNRAGKSKDRPSIIIAHTVKGRGVSFMENKMEWHYHTPQKEHYDQAMEELS